MGKPYVMVDGAKRACERIVAEAFHGPRPPRSFIVRAPGCTGGALCVWPAHISWAPRRGWWEDSDDAERLDAMRPVVARLLDRAVLQPLTRCRLSPLSVRGRGGHPAVTIDRRSVRCDRLVASVSHGLRPPGTPVERNELCSGDLRCIEPSHLRWGARGGGFAEKAAAILAESKRDPATGCLLSPRSMASRPSRTRLCKPAVKVDGCQLTCERVVAMAHHGERPLDAVVERTAPCSGHLRCVEPSHLRWQPSWDTVAELVGMLLAETEVVPRTGCRLSPRWCDRSAAGRDRPAVQVRGPVVFCEDLIARAHLPPAAPGRMVERVAPCLGDVRCLAPSHLRWKPRACAVLGCGEPVPDAVLCPRHAACFEHGEPLVPFGDARPERKPRGLDGAALVDWVLERSVRDDATGCLLWSGPVRPDGYPQISFPSRGSRSVTRRIAEVFHGPAPDERAHTCHSLICAGRRHCVEPSHLRWGSASENAIDSVIAGRHPNAKLDVAQVLEIKGRLGDGETTTLIALDYGVDPHVVRAIRRGDRWGWLDPGEARAVRSPVPWSVVPAATGLA